MKKNLFLLLISPLIFTTSFSQDGFIDSSFGDNGIVLPYVFSNAHSNSVQGMDISNSGKILITAYYFSTPPDGKGYLILLQYKADGSLDSSFGKNGIFSFQRDYWSYDDQSYYLSDGKILNLSINLTNNRLNVMRLLPSGKIDSTYGKYGNFSISIPISHFNNIKRLASAITSYDELVLGIADYGDLGIMKIKSSGSLDSSFGINGKSIISTYTPEALNTISIQNDGKILLSGAYYPNSGLSIISIMRFLQDGSLDPSFGNAGTKLDYFTSSYDWHTCTSVEQRSDGKIVVLGSHYTYNSTLRPMSVLCLNSDGSRDYSFGNQGVVDFGSPNFSNIEPTGLLLQSDDKVIISAINNSGNSSDVLVRLNKDGSFDQIFGNSAYAEVPVLGQTSTINLRNMGFQNTKRLIRAGIYDNSNSGIYHTCMVAYKLDNVLNINKISSTSTNFNIHPNPTKKKFYIDYNGNSENKLNIEIYNALGQGIESIKDYKLKDHEAIDIESFSPGNYIMILYGNSERASFQITKE